MKRKLPAEPVSKMLWIMLSALALVPLTYLPPFNPFHDPRFDLGGPVAQAAYILSFSGGFSGIPFVGLFMTVVLVTRPGISPRERWS